MLLLDEPLTLDLNVDGETVFGREPPKYVLPERVLWLVDDVPVPENRGYEDHDRVASGSQSQLLPER
jgi:hypothetical protein